MGIVRYKFLSRFGKENELVINPFPVNQVFDEDNVDRSYYVSSVDIASRQKATSLMQGAYDTAEDLARGFAIDVFARQRGRDLAEISQLKNDFEHKIKESVQDLYNSIDSNMVQSVVDSAKDTVKTTVQDSSNSSVDN